MATMATPEEEYQQVQTTTSADDVTESRTSERVVNNNRLHAVNVSNSLTGVELEDVMWQLEDQRKVQYQEIETNFLAVNSHATVDSDLSHYVQTPALEQADRILQDTGFVVLCGPLGCGKSTTARALLRRCRHQGFKIYTLRRLEDWDDHVGEGRRSVVLLDGVLGEVRVNGVQHDCWKQVLGTLMEFLAKGTCRVVVTVYPHILRELQMIESRRSPLKDDSAVMQMTDPLPESVKTEMLNFHLNSLNLKKEMQSDVVERVLRKERKSDSGPVFPWCCEYMVDHWNLSEDPTAIFKAPGEAYSQLLKNMVMDQTHGEFFAAVLALSMKGVFHFLHHVQEVGPHLEELGFERFSEDRLAVYADLLQGSVLTDGGFFSRTLYDAAGLVLGRFLRLPTLLKVCDLPFLIQYVHLRAVDGGVSQNGATNVCVTVGSVPTCSTVDRERCAVDCLSLAEKIYKEIVEGNLQAICQHPSLQSPEFLRVLDNYCSAKRQRIRQVLSARDHEYRLPLLYWSAFHPSPDLTTWCWERILDNERPCMPWAFPMTSNYKALALVACSLFDCLSQSSFRRLRVFTQDALLSKHFDYPEQVMELPLLEPNQCLNNEVQYQIETIIKAVSSSQLRLQYLDNPSFEIPPDLVTFQLTNRKLQIQIKDRRLWYLLFRLLTDRNMNEEDSRGNSILHVAARGRELAAAKLSLRAGVQIRQNRQGLTPRQMVDKARSLVAKGTGRSGLFEACCKGWADIANLYIMLGANVISFDSVLGKHLGGLLRIDEFDESATPLHYACKNGMAQTVELLIQHGANVAALTCRNNTPLHFAVWCHSPHDCANIVRLLVQAGVDINANTSWGNTPLHQAAKIGATHAMFALLFWGASVDVPNDLGNTPLLLATRYGFERMARALTCEGANVDYQNPWGNMLRCLRRKIAGNFSSRHSPERLA